MSIIFSEVAEGSASWIGAARPSGTGKRSLEKRLLELPNGLTKLYLGQAICAPDSMSPQHGRWLTMAETDIGIMNRPYLDRRLDSPEKIATEITAWENQRNAVQARLHWTFTPWPSHGRNCENFTRQSKIDEPLVLNLNEHHRTVLAVLGEHYQAFYS